LHGFIFTGSDKLNASVFRLSPVVDIFTIKLVHFSVKLLFVFIGFSLLRRNIAVKYSEKFIGGCIFAKAFDEHFVDKLKFVMVTESLSMVRLKVLV
jgi:hypothetical protein